jgi:aspartyl-tRNA(Asn)/glutamyl-tRNA(Gln) amidotransferase subunit A
VDHPLDRPLADIAVALRCGDISASELVEEAISRHRSRDALLRAYKLFDAEGARTMARSADVRFASDQEAPPLCGIPFSAKDLYGAEGLPTFAGTRRPLPPPWSRDAWLVARLRDQGAVLTGKTHTVEMAYGGVGLNPNWETPRNPWDAGVHRIPGGSSSGAGVSLAEGSAVVALGTDTGGSIRIPASMTGAVGHKTTKGRWPTEGVVPLSHTLDTVGALTRSVEDAVWFFGSVDPGAGNPAELVRRLARRAEEGVRVAVPEGGVWGACQPDIEAVLRAALEELAAAWWPIHATAGALLDDAYDLYMTGGISGVESLSFLKEQLPGWLELLHPIVGKRIAAAAARTPEEYRAALAERERLMASAGSLFADADVLALPTHLVTPPPVEGLADLGRYSKVNAITLRPTVPVSMLGLCAVTLPVGRDASGMPVGLQLVAPAGEDELVLAAALAAEGVLGKAIARLGVPERVIDRS